MADRATTGWRRQSETPLAVIREVNDRDVPRLEALYAEAVSRQADAAVPAAAPPDPQEWLKGKLRRGFNFVAEETGRLVAHLVLVRVGDSAEMSIFVHPDVRRRGIGTALLRVALDQARDMDLRHVWAAVSPGDRAIQQTLAHLGFVVSRQTETSMVMALSL
jgi:L-amino acid N-acyltransferase YncA